MSEPLTIAISGAGGRMGQAVRGIVEADDALTLGALLERPEHPEAGATYVTDIEEALTGADVIIDFSTAVSAPLLFAVAAAKGVAVVSGTTGLEDNGEEALDRAAEQIPVVWAPNMSLAMNVLFAVTEQVAGALPASYHIEIGEVHHQHKRDSPSGTALGLLRAARAARPEGPDTFGRHGTADQRAPGEIGVHALRGGEVIGEHTVYFFGPFERLELTHRVRERKTFAEGAVTAARWVHGRPPGRYDMRSVLGL